MVIVSGCVELFSSRSVLQVPFSLSLCGSLHSLRHNMIESNSIVTSQYSAKGKSYVTLTLVMFWFLRIGFYVELGWPELPM